MVTEEQRLQILGILGIHKGNMNEILKQVEEKFGMKLTKADVDAAINQLRNVRGS